MRTEPTLVDLNAALERARRTIARSILINEDREIPVDGSRAAIDSDRAALFQAERFIKQGYSLAAYRRLMDRFGAAA